MKRFRFFLTVACILIPLIGLCAYARFDMIAFADAETSYWLLNRELTNKTLEQTYDVIILGDSVANASYLPAVLSDRCLNLALSGGSPVENYYALREFLAHNPPPKICYISFVDNRLRNPSSFWDRSVYTHRFSIAENMEIFKEAIPYRDPTFLCDGYLAKYAEYELGLPNCYMTAIMNANFNQREEYNRSVYDKVKLRGGSYIGGMGEYAVEDEVIYSNFTVSPLCDWYYRKIIGLCKDNGIGIRIIKLPLPDNAVFTSALRTQFADYYEGLMEEYPNILSVDWLESYDKAEFMDYYHMNHHGALRFSTWLRERYPEDFTDEVCTTEQARAVDTYIAEENSVAEIMKWMNGRNYSAIVLDGTGEFDSYQRDCIVSEENLDKITIREMSAIEAAGFDGSGYVIGNQSGYSLNCNMGNLNVQLENGAEMTLPGGDGILGIVVIDQYNCEIAFAGSFTFQNGDYVLQ